MGDKLKDQMASKQTFLQKITLFFFDHKLFTAILSIAIVAFGAFAYGGLLKREGFPSMSIPYALGQAVYAPMEPSQADEKISKPLSEFVAKQDGVKSVSSRASESFTVLMVEYEDTVDAASTSKKIESSIRDANILPGGTELSLAASEVGWTEDGDDMVLSFYDKKDPTKPTLELRQQAEEAISFLTSKNLDLVKSIKLIDPVQAVQHPVSGEKITTQTKFERYGQRDSDKTVFYHAVAVGVKGVVDSDKLDLDKQMQTAINEFNSSSDGRRLAISASNAPMINQQISELQKTLIEGLLAVLVVGSLVVTFRSSLITVISMVFIIMATFGVLLVFGYSLNTIVLFTLILALSLIVDDTIIMTEAIDKQRRRYKDKREVIASAVKKIAKAMIAATVTAALCFAPLLFVSGLIGEFVVAVPVTVITALAISLLTALVIIPLLARFIMLAPKQLAKKEDSSSARLETSIAKGLSSPMLWSRRSRKRQLTVGLLAVGLSLAFVIGGILLSRHVQFNIFPPSKDTNEIAVTVGFKGQVGIADAEVIADGVVDEIAKEFGEDFVKAANFGQANQSSAWFAVYLTDYSKRDITAPQYVDRLEARFKSNDKVTVSARTIDVGPPPSDFEARVMVDDNREAAQNLAEDIVVFLKSTDIRRANGTKVQLEDVSVADARTFVRADGRAYIPVVAKFADTDTSTMVGLVRSAVESEFTAEKVSNYGLAKESLRFDFGMEQGNQDSFRTLLLALPALLLVIYLVLAIEFRSLLQPLLIFMAIPFSFFGITLGLYLTDNSFSFFAMLGFFALIGLSIKNTILLTDYANQARATGKHPIDAAHDALEERFRPLIATSLTAVVSLIPLAIASPFWQSLCVVLIGGLLSSTLMVVTVFPYYYLGAEYLRTVGRRLFDKFKNELNLAWD